VESELGALQVGLDEAAAGRQAGGIPLLAALAATSAGLPITLGSDLLTLEQQRRGVEQQASPGGAQLALLQQLSGITPTSGIPQQPSTKSKSGGGGVMQGQSGGVAAKALFGSSRTLKEANRPLDDTETLELIENLPVERWRYIGDDTEHIGPYAEDFHAAFKVGDDKTIHVVDALGVAIAAVKVLSREVRELKKELGR
jgi:hypothetical protein